MRCEHVHGSPPAGPGRSQLATELQKPSGNNESAPVSSRLKNCFLIFMSGQKNPSSACRNSVFCCPSCKTPTVLPVRGSEACGYMWFWGRRGFFTRFTFYSWPETALSAGERGLTGITPSAGYQVLGVFRVLSGSAQAVGVPHTWVQKPGRRKVRFSHEARALCCLWLGPRGAWWICGLSNFLKLAVSLGSFLAVAADLDDRIWVYTWRCST